MSTEVETAEQQPASALSAVEQSAEAGPSSAPTPRQSAPESSKSKQTKKTKAKAKGSGEGSNDGKPPRTSLRGGVIGVASADPPPPGWLPAGGGARKALPELVIPFRIPTLVKNGGVGIAQDSDEDHGKGASDSSEDSESDSDSEDDDMRRVRLEKRKRRERKAFESSLLKIQSLRQSRLFHLASLLAPYSRRTKAGVSFPVSLPPEKLHGIDPSIKGGHVLSPLGRVEVRVGPHIFSKTKLWEMRKEREQRATSPVVGKKAHSGHSPSSKPQHSNKATSKQTTTPPPPPSQPQASVARPPPPPPPAAPPAAAAAVDPVLVTRVNERASKDPGLRDLLQVAARGAATPDQLRSLGEVIQDVTREMERDGLKVLPPQPIVRPPAPPAGPVAAPAQTEAGGSKKANASSKKGGSGTGAIKKATVAKSGSSEEAKKPPVETPSSKQVAISSPGKDIITSPQQAAALVPSFRPPILVLEFRENPSMRFYAPLWSSLVVRRKFHRAKEVIEGEEDLTEEPVKEVEQVEVAEVQLRFLAPVIGSDAAVGTGETAKYPILMTIAAEDTSGTFWEAMGRIPGIKTLDSYGRQVDSLPVDEDEKKSQELERERKEVEELHDVIERAIASLPPRRYLNPNASLPQGLEDHLTDRFAPQLQPTASLQMSVSNANGPIFTTGGKRRFSPMDSMAEAWQAEGIIDPSLYDAAGGAGVGVASGHLVSGLGGSLAPKPKKKRNVATHNPDGTLKRCFACQTNVTPMWRRGPDGPATLCNACGARWKSGRLGMPNARGRKGSAAAAPGGGGGGGGAGGGDGDGGVTATEVADSKGVPSQREKHGEDPLSTTNQAQAQAQGEERGETSLKTDPSDELPPSNSKTGNVGDEGDTVMVDGDADADADESGPVQMMT